MTRTRFAFAALFQSFGVLRKTKRLTDAAFEMHLMQDGEELLGSFCWKNVEDIEELSMEYWNLRRMEREEDELNKKLEEAEKTLATAQSSRADLVGQSNEDDQELIEERESLLEQIDNLHIEHDNIMEKAAATKRKHAALTMKAKVLKEEGADDESPLTKCREDLDELKEIFTKSKADLIAVNEKIDTLDEEHKGLQMRIDDKREGSKGASDESFSKISKANQDITKFQADIGLLNEEQGKICREVGRFLNINANRPDCKKACKEHRGLLEQVRLLYRSIQLNRRLVERVS